MVGYYGRPRAVLWTAPISACPGVAHAEPPFTERAVCRTCRRDIYTDFYKNPHARTMQANDAPPDRSGCEGRLVPDPALPEFRAAQAFPTPVESPQARLPVRIHEKLRWSVGYQFCSDRGEDFSTLLQRYRAHTGCTSLPWSL